MSRFAREQRGSVSLLAILLLPTLLVALLGVLDLGALRVVAERARIAADLATVVAVNDQDQAHLAATGRLRPAGDAREVARAVFAANLEPLGPSLASSPSAVADAADIAVFSVAGEVDPLTGRAYAGSTVRLAADVPVLTPALGPLLARPVTLIRVFSASSAR